MAKADLPREVRSQPLGYDQLVSVLDLIEAEPVVVRVNGRAADPAAISGVASIVGELTHQVPARYPGHEFAVGTPYPDLYPEHVVGGVLFVNEPEFESATLTTFDGNDYFSISIRTCAVEILVEGQDSSYP
jgi:hypothetical protein